MKTPVVGIFLLGLVAGASAVVQKCGAGAGKDCDAGAKTNFCCVLTYDDKGAVNGGTCTGEANCKKDKTHECTTMSTGVCNKPDMKTGMCTDGTKTTVCKEKETCCKITNGKGTCAETCGNKPEEKCTFADNGKGQVCKETDKARADAKAKEKQDKEKKMKDDNKDNCQKGADVLTAKECNGYCCIDDGKCGTKEECEKDGVKTCVFTADTKGKACTDYKKYVAKPAAETKKCDLAGADVPCGDDAFICCDEKAGDKEKKTKGELCLKADKCKDTSTDVCHFKAGLSKDKKKCKSLAAKSGGGGGGNTNSDTTKKPNGATTAAAAGPLLAGLLLLPNLFPNNN